MSDTFTYRTGSGELITLKKKFFDQGGEGTLHFVLSPNFDTFVAKLYKPGQLPDKEKIKKLISFSKRYQTSEKTFYPYGIAWIKELLYDGGTVVGVLLPFINNRISFSTVYNCTTRKDKNLHITLRTIIGFLYGIARLTKIAHENSIVIGDFNHNNFLLQMNPDGFCAYLIDVDAIQIDFSQTEFYYCNKNVPEYTPPEVFKQTSNKFRREPSGDVFSFGIFVFQGLYQSFHPFGNSSFIKIPKPERDNPKYKNLDTITGRIIEDASPFGSLSKFVEWAPLFKMFFNESLAGKELWNLFERTFQSNPRLRPSIDEYISALINYFNNLKKCNKLHSHYYPKQMSQCIWCEAKSKGADYFPYSNHLLIDINDIFVIDEGDKFYKIFTKENDNFYTSDYEKHIIDNNLQKVLAEANKFQVESGSNKKSAYYFPKDAQQILDAYFNSMSQT